MKQWEAYASGLQEELRQSRERAAGLEGEVDRIWADLESRDQQWREYGASLQAQARPCKP